MIKVTCTHVLGFLTLTRDEGVDRCSLSPVGLGLVEQSLLNF